MVITGQGDPPGLVLTGTIREADLDRLRAAVLAMCGDVRVDLRAVPFVQVVTLRTLVRTAAELDREGRCLVLDLAPHHEWAIDAIGWSTAPGLVMANGELPR
ncbi:hypothetical protein [Actinosynnema sp. NPDC020468]|uniref:hypothetical protein n=1 Tax=Actinosynnema sp. NPDC020468 TaxID=3154488 RepID=UPI003410AFA3